MTVKDIFGGELVPNRQPDPNGHYWVGIGTEVEHCMRCMQGVHAKASLCTRHPPAGHPGGPPIVSDETLDKLLAGSLHMEDLDWDRFRALVLELRDFRRAAQHSRQLGQKKALDDEQ
jgi:hypothetical protein